RHTFLAGLALSPTHSAERKSARAVARPHGGESGRTALGLLGSATRLRPGRAPHGGVPHVASEGRRKCLLRTILQLRGFWRGRVCGGGRTLDGHVVGGRTSRPVGACGSPPHSDCPVLAVSS